MPFYPNGAPIFVPSTSTTSVGVGITSLSDDTTGGGNTAIGNTAANPIEPKNDTMDIIVTIFCRRSIFLRRAITYSFPEIVMFCWLLW